MKSFVHQFARLKILQLIYPFSSFKLLFIKEKTDSESMISDFLSNWNNIQSLYYILSSTNEEMTLFVTFEYLNKIVLSEKGFINFPEKTSLLPWKEDDDNSVLLETSIYNQLLNFFFELIKIKPINKNFIINSLCNLIAQIIRIVWNELGPVSSLIERIYESMIKNVRETPYL